MKSLIKILIVLVMTTALFAQQGDGAAKKEPNKPAEKEPNAPAQQEPEEIPDVNTIVENAQIAAYYQGADGRARVNMTIVNKQGQKRNREFLILRQDVNDGGNQKYYVYFQRPADVREMVYMVHKHAGWKDDDDRWLYLPSLDLVKRIAAGDKRTSFVGSHYLYEDVSGRSPEADTHELIEVTDEFYVLKNVPRAPDMVKFKYYIIHVDKETWLPVKMEYYDQNDKLYRTIEATEIEKIQGFPTPVKSVVKDLESEGHTVMEYSDVEYNVDLPDIFTERYLRRPPRIVLR